jgi:hypothetical protein
LEAFGLGIMISLAMLALEVLVLGMYLSALRRRTSRKKLEPYLMILYSLICCSTAIGLVSFYRGQASNFKTATQALVLVCLIPNFAIILILLHGLGFFNMRTQDRLIAYVFLTMGLPQQLRGLQFSHTHDFVTVTCRSHLDSAQTYMSPFL